MPRGPRLPAKACPHALPQALPMRVQEQAVQKLTSLLSALLVSLSPTGGHFSNCVHASDSETVAATQLYFYYCINYWTTLISKMMQTKT